MNPVWIVEASTVTAFGNHTDQLWKGLMDGRTMVRPVQRFPVKGYQSDSAALIEDLVASGNQSLIHSMVDRVFEKSEKIPTDSCLITATAKSGIDNMEKLYKTGSADTRDILLSALTGIITQKYGLKKQGINISAACASSTVAVARAAGMIASGRAESVAVCSLDFITEFVFSGFSALKVMSRGPSRPFDKERSGLSLGDGAVYILLMSSKRAKKEKRSHLGSVIGWGIANDAAHITSPAKDGSGLILAVNKALKTAGIDHGSISAVNAHGTGTVYNDLMELTAVNNIFGGRRVPVHSIKGAIGHTLGAAGGIEIAVGLKALEEQIIPPTAGFKYPEKGAGGLVSSKPEEISGNYLLTTNSGFGGINAALVLQRGTGV